MGTSEISEHQVRVYAFALQAATWVTANEIAAGASVAKRTARAHALRFVKLGIFDQAEVFPAHRYRLSPLASKRNRTLVQRVEEAQKIFAV